MSIQENIEQVVREKFQESIDMMVRNGWLGKYCVAPVDVDIFAKDVIMEIEHREMEMSAAYEETK